LCHLKGRLGYCYTVYFRIRTMWTMCHRLTFIHCMYWPHIIYTLYSCINFKTFHFKIGHGSAGQSAKTWGVVCWLELATIQLYMILACHLRPLIKHTASCAKRYVIQQILYILHFLLILNKHFSCASTELWSVVQTQLGAWLFGCQQL
jgi:hypothetical protein